MSVPENEDETFSNENNMSLVMRDIYESCDEAKIGRVPVSKLVNYIKPFMESDVPALNGLQISLDPEETDPAITSDMFYTVMSDWARRFDQQDSFHNISPSNLAMAPLVESTPRKSFGNRQLRVYAEAAALNMSIVEQGSFVSTYQNESIMEKSVLEEQIKQLTHQSRKYNDELLLARSQLLSQEEQNLVLQSEIEKLTKELKHEHEVNDNLQRQNKTFEEVRENSFNKQRCIDQLKKELQHFEKENQQLQAQNTFLDDEKQKMEEKMVLIHAKLSEARKETIELQAEINMKDEQLVAVEEMKQNLLTKITDQTDIISNLEEANKCLKVEKDTFTKLLQEHIKKQSTMNFSPQQSEYKASHTSKTDDSHKHVLTNAKHMHAQLYADIMKLFTPPSTQKEHSTSTSDVFASTPKIEDRVTCTQPKNDTNSAITEGSHLSEIKNNSQLISHNGCSPVPFASPIKTSKFTFYNIDCPVAKRSISQQITASSNEYTAHHNSNKPTTHCNSPNTPIDLGSPPELYVIERSADRKPAKQELQNISIDESTNDEEFLQTALSSIGTPSQASLMEELAALKIHPQPALSPTLVHQCPNCDIGIQKRLDDMCEQIGCLQSENASLRQSANAHLLEEEEKQIVIQQGEQTIVELNMKLQKSMQSEQETSNKYIELMSKVEKLENVEKNLDDSMQKISSLRNDLQQIQFEKEKLLKTNSVDQDMIARLNDNLKSVQNEKKFLDLKILNLQAEKEKIVESHMIHIDEQTKQFQQAQDDISELELKFYAINDQLTSLFIKNEELAKSNAKLRSQHQNVVELNHGIQSELQGYIQMIERTSTGKQSTAEKLALLKTVDEYNSLELKIDELTKDKQNESEKLNSRIADLEKQCNQILSAKGTPKKTPYDRTQIKLEKMCEKIDYLEDVLKQEKINQSALKQQIQLLQQCNESLIKDNLTTLQELDNSRCLFVQGQNAYRELLNETSDLCNVSLKARHNMLKLGKNWKPLFEKIDSIGPMLSYLGTTLTGDLTITTESVQTNLKGIVHTKDDIQTMSLILDVLASYNMSNNQDIQGLSVLKELQGVKSSQHLRPVSPDSPNLGVLDEITSASRQSISINRSSNHNLPDSEGCECDGSELSCDEHRDGLEPDTLEVLKTMYLPENLELFFNSIRCEKPSEDPSELAHFVDDFGLTFMVDCTGYRNRLQNQFDLLREIVERLVHKFSALCLQVTNSKRQKRSMSGIVNCISELTKLAERYGAIQQEVEGSRTINCLISYITHLRNGRKKDVSRNLRGETVLIDNTHFARSDAGSENDINLHAEHRIMSILHTMRPANVVHLVGATALAFIVYYFSQQFIFLLAESDSNDGLADHLPRNPICWSAWMDFLATCFGRLHEDGPPPV